MPNTEKLLSIRNLKKYFPVAKKHIFSKGQLYVRANEDITLDIRSGETLGLVGESGCGKSTLGRTVLQLYTQTAGSTLYYGRTIEEFAPRYVIATMVHCKRMIRRWKKLQKRADMLTREVEIAADKATFLQHQAKNLAVAEADTAFFHVVKILGGLTSLDDPSEGARLQLRCFYAKAKRSRIERQICTLEDVGGLWTRKEKLESALHSAVAEVAAGEAALTKYKACYAGNEKFNEYEQLLDDGIDLTRLTNRELRKLRKDLQIIFQDPYSSLNPRMTVGQTIAEGLVTHKFFKPGDPKMHDYILTVMARCGLQEHMLHRYPHQFSGGQRQRIAIARALAVKPKFVVCDECVSALDVSIQSQIINLLQELKQQEQLTYLFISHDLSVVRYISDRIGVMYLGNIVELGTAEEVFGDPRHPYTVALLSSIPSLDADCAHKKRLILKGNLPSPVRPPDGCKFHTRCYMACEKCAVVPPPKVETSPGHFVVCHFPDKKINDRGEYLFVYDDQKQE